MAHLRLRCRPTQLCAGAAAPPLLLLLSLLLLAPSGHALDNGVALVPPRGWTTWELFNFNVNDTVLRSLALEMVALGVRDAGYDILWLDDGWPSCAQFSPPPRSGCNVPAPRAPNGTIIPDPAKFPFGLKATFDFIHAQGLKVGIYTAPHAQTCGGFTGSLNYEAIDAATFAAWGVDAVKLDAGCREDCSIHDGCITASLTRMRDGLNATGRPMVYYVDDGNPTSGPKVYNPFGRGWPQNNFTATHIARTWQEEVVSWGPSTANMYKLWFDRSDNWRSLLDNVHQQVGMQWFQKSGAFLAPDQMTIGQGGMSIGQYRAEVFLYAALSAPMFLSCDPSALRADKDLLDLVTNPEILAVNWDPDCVMATLATPLSNYVVRSDNPAYRYATQLYLKPMSDGSFVAVLVNLDPIKSHEMQVIFGDGDSSSDGTDTDIFPANFARARVRDLDSRTDLGVFLLQFSLSIPPLDARIVRIFPA